ncbi:glycosyltransferase family 2 protein [Thalassovita sp.]|uniref:glycosyltransferase family 2 protein n=1 Tax=Thalassovita sp. TaxID=1979401 RepID=UPI002881909A|nr:glycosyltransferase family 2 protein [Thalassovita sp.]MDF1802918.1 glycosyltransferase family 2 protein [Thalassovita sp.]
MPNPVKQSEKVALVSCMRNEGLFLLEWVAYHQGLGFDTILIITNNCTDGSDELAQALAQQGHIIHIDQTVPTGASPQDTGMDLALTWLRAHEFTWVLHIDSDEFLLIDHGNGQIADLLYDLQQADVVPIPWRNFGDSGVTNWTPGASVLNTFTSAEPEAQKGITKFKCLFRVAHFERATDHNPLCPTIENPCVLSPDAEPLSNRSLYQDKSSRFRPHDIACRAKRARLNHYAVKSQDLFLMKNDRGDGQGKTSDSKYHIGSRWHRAANRNDIEDRTILRHWPETERRLAHLRATPTIASAEQHCQEWFVQHRAEILTPDRRADWTRGKARA